MQMCNMSNSVNILRSPWFSLLITSCVRNDKTCGQCGQGEHKRREIMG